MSNNTPRINVVTEATLRKLVAEGAVCEVICQTSVFKKGPTWYGVWVVRSVGTDGMERQLVTARANAGRGDIKVREFKTVTGLVSFLMGVGFTHADIPLQQGQRTRHQQA